MTTQPSPQLAKFLHEASQSGAQNGIPTAAIIAMDPVTKQIVLFATPGAIPQLKEFVARKFGLTDPNVVEVEWGQGPG